MKNKHLVLLFLLTLLVGLAVRQAPWKNATFFHTKLLPVDTVEVRRMDISVPGQSGLVLVRNDAGWLAEQQDRSAKVPPKVAQMMLAVLADLRSVRIAKTDQPDTLGFSRSTAIEIIIYYAHAPTEQLSIGWETIENSQPSTFVRLPRHKGIYLVENQLRAVFSKTLMDFRNAAVVQFEAAAVQHFSVFGQNLDSLSFQKNDSIGNWQSAALVQAVPNESVQQWLKKISGLKKLPFADLFDESHANKTIFAQINLTLSNQTEPLILKIYRLGITSLPEELPDKPLEKNQFAPYVLYFSQYPTTYYALSDTTLLRQICQPF
jgi:hypothetical protein